tara:strand:+ start:253 stop:957 length:705 start_codon:yes stop_codon:yes gene_type:complete
VILIELPFLDPTIFYADDSPRVWRRAVPKFVRWKDAENALNAPWNHIITVIDDDGKRMDLDMVEEPWFYKQVPRKEQLFDLVNNGYTINICQYGHGNTYIESLLKTIESTFDGCCDAHLFVTSGRDNSHPSFKPHFDKPCNFIMQMEGKTRWKVYNERCSALLEGGDPPYTPSQDELTIAIDTVLEEGDVLYFGSRYYHNTEHTEGSRLSVSIPIWFPKRCECSDRKHYKLLHE